MKLATAAALTLFLFAHPTLYAAGESEQNREKQDFTIVSSPLIFSFGPSTFGVMTILNVEYYLDANSHVDLFLSSEYSGGGQYDVDSQFVRLKQFLGNSFYIAGGLGSRTIHWDQYYSEPSGSDSYSGPEVKTRVDSIGITGGLGHHWQWSYFTLGAEWFAFFHPVFEYDSKVTTYGTGGTESNDHYLELAREDNTSSIKLPRLFIGVSF